MNKPKNQLTVIIPSRNEGSRLHDTLASLTDTFVPQWWSLNVIVVDDGSVIPETVPNEDPRIRIIRNSRTIGVSASRHIGATMAAAQGVEDSWLLFTDAHMRFDRDWMIEFAAASLHIEIRDVACGRCIGLDSLNTDMASAKKDYWGARFALAEDGKLFECVWNTPPANTATGAKRCLEIQAVMGASYFISAEGYFEFNPFRHLRGWGCEEQMLSINAHLSGARVLLLPGVKIGHVWRAKGEHRPWMLADWYVTYNKLFCIHTLFPPFVAQSYAQLFPKDSKFEKAYRLLMDDWQYVEMERRRNEARFQHDFRWLIERFGLAFPGV
jgi:glycosyltransferase involved in cell wall biosynthesis